MTITTEQVRELFDYRDGELYWRRRANRKVPAGSRAGFRHSHGHWNIRINGKNLFAHRLIWLWHGRDLPPRIDHINGDPADNRIENLRACTQRQNIANQRIKANNTSGFKGVSYDKSRGKFAARIRMPDGRRPSLGRFDTPEEAAAAYQCAFIEQYGEFARLS